MQIDNAERHDGAQTHKQAMDEAVACIIQDVCELDGYTSPDDNPDLLQCTVQELTLILRRHLCSENMIDRPLRAWLDKQSNENALALYDAGIAHFGIIRVIPD